LKQASVRGEKPGKDRILILCDLFIWIQRLNKLTNKENKKHTFKDILDKLLLQFCRKVRINSNVVFA
jgi:hypothetical protein